VDDFEHYDAGRNRIGYAWKDGRDYRTQDSPLYYPGNQTGSAVRSGSEDCFPFGYAQF